METFTLIVFGGLAILLLGLIALGAWNPRSIAEITGRADQRRWAIQAQVEGADIEEMVDSHNAMRRRRGKAEVSEREIRERANVAQRQSIQRARTDDDRDG
jgi:predicted Holliday junction resolvase-like endonuclease